jgi:hypothetical protein
MGITDVSIETRAREPWTLKFGGAIRPEFMELLRNELIPDGVHPAYSVSRFHVPKGRFSSIFMDFIPQNYATFYLEREILDQNLILLGKSIDFPRDHVMPVLAPGYYTSVVINGNKCEAKHMSILFDQIGNIGADAIATMGTICITGGDLVEFDGEIPLTIDLKFVDNSRSNIAFVVSKRNKYTTGGVISRIVYNIVRIENISRVV